eukprot:1195883-Prorocentrum_minimum.AAC.4
MPGPCVDGRARKAAQTLARRRGNSLERPAKHRPVPTRDSPTATIATNVGGAALHPQGATAAHASTKVLVDKHGLMKVHHLICAAGARVSERERKRKRKLNKALKS